MASTPLCLSFASVLDNVREPPADLGKSNDALCCLCRIQNSEFGPVEPAPNSFESLYAKQFSSNHLGFSIISKYVTIDTNILKLKTETTVTTVNHKLMEFER